jgi:probable HAF family extracellular repeat protein
MRMKGSLAAWTQFCASRTCRLAVIGAFAAAPASAHAQRSCVKETTVVAGPSHTYFVLKGNEDFVVRKAYVDGTGLMYIMGDDNDFVPGKSVIYYPYTIICTPDVGMKFLDEKKLQGSDKSGGVTAMGVGGTSGTPTALLEGAASFSGTTLVGFQDAGLFTPYHAFRWTEAGGAVDLGTLIPANNATRSSHASGVSNDGAVVVGYSDISSVVQHAFRWTAASGMVDLGAPAGATRQSRAHDVNRDGTVIVGEADFPDAAAFTGIRSSAFRWTAASGMQSLGALQPGYFTRAVDITPDGSTIVGEGGIEIVVGNSSTNGSRAFRWTASSGIQNLGTLPGHRFANATAVSDNGGVIVGTSQPETGPSFAFRWTQATGMQDLRQVLVSKGLNLTGIQLLTAVTVTGNGQFIMGKATTPETSMGATTSYLVQVCDAAIVGPCVQITFAPVNPDFSLTAAATSALAVVAGRSVNTSLTITPAGGFNRQVGFSCSGLPTGATCSFSPSTVTAGSSVSTTLTISTTGPTFFSNMGSALLIALLVAPALLLRSHRTHSSGARRFRFAVPVALAFATSCGGGGDGTTAPPPPPPPPSGGTPAGSYVVTVTAATTTGTPVITKTVSLTLNVTR